MNITLQWAPSVEDGIIISTSSRQCSWLQELHIRRKRIYCQIWKSSENQLVNQEIKWLRIKRGEFLQAMGQITPQKWSCWGVTEWVAAVPAAGPYTARFCHLWTLDAASIPSVLGHCEVNCKPSLSLETLIAIELKGCRSILPDVTSYLTP